MADKRLVGLTLIYMIMNCPNCNRKVASFSEWHRNKCFKTRCSFCKKQLVADTVTKVSLFILGASVVIGGLAISLHLYQPGTSNRGNRLLVISTLIVLGTLFTYLVSYFLYKKVCGYVVKKPIENNETE